MTRHVLLVCIAVPALIAGCTVRRAPAPESTRQLRVEEVRRVVEQPVLSPAAWSPDGTRMAYSAAGGVYVTRPGGPPRKIAPAEVATSVSWSARLDVLAVVDRGAVWTLRPDGSERRRIDLPGPATTAVWAPSSDRLGVLLRHEGAAASAFELWLVSRDGGFRRRVTRAPERMAMRDLQWLPNSLYLIYGLSAAADPVVREVWQVRVSYPDVRRIPLAGPAAQVRVAPSGRAIAYVTGDAIEDGRGRVVVSRMDGTGRFVVTPQPGRYSGLAWSPQGDKLAFAEVIDEIDAEIWIADADASGRLLVHAYAMEFSDPSILLSMSWSPDGRRLAFGTNSGSFTGPIWVAEFSRR